MANLVSKNLEKTGETAIMAAIAVVATWAVNRFIPNIPGEVTTAMLVIITAASAGIWNWLTHRTTSPKV